MEPSELKKWEEVSKKGILRYVFKYGALIALGFAAYLSWYSLNPQELTGFDIAGVAIISLLGGIAISVILWYRKEIPHQYINQNEKLN